MSGRALLPLLAGVLAVLALANGAAMFESVHGLDKSTPGDPNGVPGPAGGSSAERESASEGGTDQPEPTPSEPTSTPTETAASTGGSDPTTLAVLALVGGAAITGLVIRLLSAGDGTEVDNPPAADDGPAGDTGGRAPVRDPDDGVAAAWAQFATATVGSAWPRRTPGQVAAAARAAGAPTEPVTDLRELFERVRYGDDRPTERREERAADLVDRLLEDR
ncbi:DUF4129 domain-containing protein [Halobaculum limi]|uniref:DUF4129 domain-containing protein n=1 Tax=Halobaculum limi TaxID=3031916 RepID=UPI002406C466|nr:DUF4129 domain-containing protein [Halobaculum sp. YSMS11]